MCCERVCAYCFFIHSTVQNSSLILICSFFAQEYEDNGRIALYGSRVVTGTGLGLVLCIGGNT